MARRRMFWQLYPSYLLITVAVVIAVAWYSSSTLRNFYLSQVKADLEARAHLAKSQLAPHLAGPPELVDSLSKLLGSESATRVTVILPTGLVIGDSEEDPQVMENHANRPEIAEAFLGDVGMSTRYSRTLGKMLMYVAVPVKLDGEVTAVIRTSLPVTAVDDVLAEITKRIVVVAAIVAALAALVGLGVSRRLSRPLEELRLAAQRFAGGELDRRVSVSGSVETASLGKAMNQMAVQLDDRIRTVTSQRNLQEAILSSMSEGVIAVDTEQRIIDLNSAAADMIGVQGMEARGKTIQEIVRSSELRRLVSDALSGSGSVEGDIVFRHDRERYVQGHGTVLRDAAGGNIGVLIVLNDITRLKRLENIRRDFVANVSHELKTPITSIKGFVETLQDSSFENLEEVRRFLGIIGSHTDRLDSIIEDLLSLSRLEQASDSADLQRELAPLIDILQAGARACELQSSSRGIIIAIDCDKDILCRVNRPLIEQAVVNLIDNAIKYSDDNTEIKVSGEESGSGVTISVHDQGIGIAKEHLPRIFERFYRVDRGRSRKLGSTGLGLAITKHIALAHGGRVSVESTPGEGSTFSIFLPRRDEGGPN
jgi:two-component system phosphate regulon sensor histidine kinase PhoR